MIPSKDVHDVYAFVGILFVAIVLYGIFSRMRGRKLTVLVVLEGGGDDEQIQKGALEAGNDLKIKVLFANPETFEEDVDLYNPDSIVSFSNTLASFGKGLRVFNGLNPKENKPADAFSAGYLAVVSARVNFMSEEFEERKDEDKDEDIKKSVARPFPGRL